MIDAVIVLALLVCAALAVRSPQILTASIWLGAASALLSLWLYRMGAREIAVIELSVGAGLVTVLLVFVIGVTGQETREERALIPPPVSWALVIGSFLLLAGSVLPLTGTAAPFPETGFMKLLWRDRGLDVLLQIVLIFAGVLGVLSLLGSAQAFAHAPALARETGIDTSRAPASSPPLDGMVLPSGVESPQVAPQAPPEEVRL